MSATGYTPIQLYYSTTATQQPLSANLASGELAVNITDGKLYYKDNTGTVKLLAYGTTASGNLPGGATGSVPYQSAASTTTFLPIGASTYILTSSGTLPQYTNPASITVGNATVATNLASGSAYQIPYQTGSSTTAFTTAPTTAGTVLGWNGSAFAWVSAPAATSATNLSGGGAYTVVYQSSAGSTAYLTNGTSGQVLTANTGGAPTWSTINALPSQTGNAGKYLTTDGTNASWASSGASAGGVIWENSTNISSNYTLTTSKNGLSVGPITIASGVAVTVPSGQRWVVL